MESKNSIDIESKKYLILEVMDSWSEDFRWNVRDERKVAWGLTRSEADSQIEKFRERRKKMDAMDRSLNLRCFNRDYPRLRDANMISDYYYLIEQDKEDNMEEPKRSYLDWDKIRF